MVFEFGNQLGWFAFLALIPLVIVYLIRPKPTLLKVPSLMFFIKRSNVRTTQSLFRRFQNDLLFLLQLITLALLAFSITVPSLILNRDVVSGNIVFVLDVSASSKVLEGDKTRLEIAKDKIKDLATSRNSLILMKGSPVIALQNVRRSELVGYLDRVQSTDSESDFVSAIMLAGDMLASNKGRVVVAGDLIESKGVDADVAKNILESRGIGVDFLDTKLENRKNIGIVDMIISGEDVNLYVKNYNDLEEDISLKINDDTNNLKIGAGSVEPVVFTLKSNTTTVEILNQDDFSADNKVVVVRPYPDMIRTLWITSKPSKFLQAALNSIEGVSVITAEPPVIPEDDFDIYLISDLNKENLAFDNLGSIFRRVRDHGGTAIVVAQKSSSEIDYEKLLPFELNNFTSGGLTVVNQVNKFTKDIDFGLIDNVYEVSGENSIVSVGNNTVVSLFEVGEGNVVYYGVIESESDFELTPGYPIFWNNLIYSLIGRGNLNDVNLKTGFILEIGNKTEILDNVGIYRLGKLPISVNLLNEKESNINFIDTESSVEYVEGELESIKADVDYRLDLYLVAIALIIILLEFVYIKYRGEI